MITEGYFLALGSTKCSELTHQWLQIMYLEGQCMDSDRIPEWGAMVFLPDQTFFYSQLKRTFFFKPDQKQKNFFQHLFNLIFHTPF